MADDLAEVVDVKCGAAQRAEGPKINQRHSVVEK